MGIRSHLVLLNASKIRASRSWYEPSWPSGQPGAPMNTQVQALWDSNRALAMTGKLVSGNIFHTYCHFFFFFPLSPLCSQEPGNKPLFVQRSGSCIFLTEEAATMVYIPTYLFFSLMHNENTFCNQLLFVSRPEKWRKFTPFQELFAQHWL